MEKITIYNAACQWRHGSRPNGANRLWVPERTRGIVHIFIYSGYLSDNLTKQKTAIVQATNFVQKHFVCMNVDDITRKLLQ